MARRKLLAEPERYRYASGEPSSSSAKKRNSDGGGYLLIQFSDDIEQLNTPNRLCVVRRTTASNIPFQASVFSRDLKDA
ncbi:hypothetical protein KOW79_001530 [Hemibagrus wyckioides]|uniref:Uncharacterized protein n=1 Tax=Hemibagrus wyckioides TaxID=337641 RepID=A0A9D3P7G2_9TELE|nr:hypothetical protein KOW79_001530 [Hemibagrus wyckioides]